MSTTDEFTVSAGAYVLGALAPEERHRFEAHLATGCAVCGRAVAEFAGLPALLRTATPPGSTLAPPLPQTLLPGLISRVTRHRRRVRRLSVSGGLAAACAVAAVVFAVLPATQSPAPDQPPRVTLNQVDTDAPVTITAAFAERDWGTRIDLECRYRGWQGGGGTGGAPDGPGGIVYSLELTDTSGHAANVASWRASGGPVTTVDATTSLRRNEIRSLRVLTSNGHVISQLGG